MRAELVRAEFVFLSLLVGLCASCLGFAAGGVDGGGGKSVVCRNPGGTIRTAEILDLYEGRTVYGLQYRESPRPWREQVPEIFRASGVSTGQTMPPSGIYDWYLNAVQHLTFLPKGTALKPIDDSHEAIIPEGCSLEQTVQYQNDRLILVSSEIWSALSETQKAALLIHESVYRVLRASGEADSRRARHFTAHIVSGNKIEATFPGNDYQLFCRGGEPGKVTFFYALKLPASAPDEQQKLRLQFDTFGGRKLMSKAYVDLNLVIQMGQGVPDTNVLEQLKQPTQWIRMQSLTLNSLFEPGDTFDLWFHSGQDGKWMVQILGTSIVDGSSFEPVNLTCY